MNKYTAELIKTFSGRKDSRAIVVDGSVTISVGDGEGNWVESDTLETGAHELFTRNLYLKFTPVSGSFSIDMKE